MAPKTLHYNPKTLMSGSIKVGPIYSSLRASTSRFTCIALCLQIRKNNIFAGKTK